MFTLVIWQTGVQTWSLISTESQRHGVGWGTKKRSETITVIQLATIFWAKISTKISGQKGRMSFCKNASNKKILFTFFYLGELLLELIPVRFVCMCTCTLCVPSAVHEVATYQRKYCTVGGGGAKQSREMEQKLKYEKLSRSRSRGNWLGYVCTYLSKKMFITNTVRTAVKSTSIIPVH